jgi:TRAP-type uncharacterized transport system fused permease subunit
LIDFGFAVKAGTKCSYSGTLKFASDDILMKLCFDMKKKIYARYIDDWVSFSYIIVSLTYPAFTKLDIGRISLYDFVRVRAGMINVPYLNRMISWFEKREREQLEFDNFVAQLNPFLN